MRERGGLLAAARGDAPCELLLANARVVNTFTAEVEDTCVAVYHGRIAGLGDYSAAEQVVDLKGRFLVPGLIDGHVHLESSYLDVGQYARAVVPRGTLGVVTDLHEIANVAGLEGLRYVTRRSRRVPMDMFFMAPSCVPSSSLETTGARLGPQEIRRLLRWRGFIGLGEVMDFPGVIGGDDGVLAKLRAAGRRVKDGHAPGLRGRALNAYLTALIGSDHEATTYDEGLEKLRRGMFLMIREGSAEKNLEALLPLVNDSTYHRCMLVVDDRNAKDLHSDGDVDAVVRKAVGLGLDPIRAVQMTTVNPARYFGLEGLGAIAPGYWANLLVLEDLKAFRVEQAYYRGRLVAQEGRPLFGMDMEEAPSLGHTVNIRPFSPSDLALRSSRDTLPVIEIVPGQVVTRRTEERVQVRHGVVAPDPSRDLLKLVVVERHHATGNIGVALVRGFGLRRGALASSVAHDAHNVVAVGVSGEEVYAAIKEVERKQGGLAVVSDGKALASLPLPVAGLLSREPLETVVGKLEELEVAAKGLGCLVESPFSVLSFLALPVIPELKLTDRGLVDVMQGSLLSLT